MRHRVQAYRAFRAGEDEDSPMLKLALPIMMGAAVLAGAMPAAAADLYQPPIVEAPPPIYVTPEPAPSFSGWYIRGDVGYGLLGFRGASYITYGCPVGSPTCTPPGP